MAGDAFTDEFGMARDDIQYAGPHLFRLDQPWSDEIYGVADRHETQCALHDRHVMNAGQGWIRRDP